MEDINAEYLKSLDVVEPFWLTGLCSIQLTMEVFQACPTGEEDLGHSGESVYWLAGKCHLYLDGDTNFRGFK